MYSRPFFKSWNRILLSFHYYQGLGTAGIHSTINGLTATAAIEHSFYYHHRIGITVSKIITSAAPGIADFTITTDQTLEWPETKN